jgi:hypothetical protein
MRRHLLKFFVISSFLGLSFCEASIFQTREKIYIDQNEFSFSDQDNDFHIHSQNNIWLLTKIVHKDNSGLFTYESDLNTEWNELEGKMAYQKEWKCPYCYKFWPIGKPCQNPDCPSKYKD